MKKEQQNFGIVNTTNNMMPIISEDSRTRQQWIPYGVYGSDDFFDAIDLAYRVSTTNAACIEGLADLIYGKGMYSKNVEFDKLLSRLIPQEETKRVVFDLKMYGNAAFQVHWNREHTKILKMYHIPIHTLRAEKIKDGKGIQNYYYCVDWSDQRSIRNKKVIPKFGTSNENVEILYIKNYVPGLYYYSLPDWVASLQYAFSEGEVSNLHYNNITNGFLPAVMINFNNGVPSPEERQTIEDLIQSKFTGTDNAGRFMVSFNDDATNKPTLDVIQIDNLHDKYQYVAEYTQDRILVSHRITSPLLFGIRTNSNGFSSQSEEMMTAFSIMQTMTISPFQNLILNTVQDALKLGGYEDTELYFEQLTPLAILSETAEDTDQTISEVEEDVNESMENPNTESEDEDDPADFENEEYEIFKINR